MNYNLEQVKRAAMPKGDARYSEEEKARAIRLFTESRWSLRKAAATVKCSPHTLRAWVDEYNARLKNAGISTGA